MGAGAGLNAWRAPILVFWAGMVCVATTAVAAQIDSSRILTIGGAVTEIAYALGAADRIVGVDTTSVFPPEALKTKPNVGYMRALSAEGILSLKPTLVVAVEGSGPPDALKLVTDAGVSLVSVPDKPTPEGVAVKIEAIGDLLGQSEKAHALAEDTKASFANLAERRAQIKDPVRVLFVLSLQNGRAMAAGRNTAADAAIRLAGAVNAASDIEGYKPMTDEAIAGSAPDVILKMTNGGLVGSPDEVFSLPAFAKTPAAANRALIGMGGVYLLGFGPRTPEALRDLMAALYPGLSVPPLAHRAGNP